MKSFKILQLTFIFILFFIITLSSGIYVGKSNSLVNTTKFITPSIVAKAITSDISSVNARKLDIDYTDIKVNMVTTKATLMRIEVFEKMTLEELSAKLDRSLGGVLQGHGNIIASHSLELGVDPYVVAAIMIHETGNGTSNIARNCYNFGGQKGAGCGAYKRYNTVDEGLVGIINNLYRNYYACGLTTVETIAPKYAESSEWPNKINNYINKIRAS